jgi:SagB-type dehydrogenase family enzyme
MVSASNDQRWRVSAFVGIAWRNGSIEITSSATDVTLRAHSARILDILHAFASPSFIADVVDTWSKHLRWEVTDCIGQLIDAGMLVTATGVEPIHWQPAALAYHRLSRKGSHVVDIEKSAARGHVGSADSALVSLGHPSPPRLRDFADVLAHRRSTRSWESREIDLSTFSTLLWMSAANRPHPSLFDDEGVSRPYPSGGGLYSLEIYPVIGSGAVDSVIAGVYRYRADCHAMEVLARGATACEPFLSAGAEAIGQVDRPPVLLLISSRIALQSKDYHQNAYSLVLKEVGALFQTLYLVCAYLGLTGCALGGGTPDNLLTDLSGTHNLDNPVVGEFAVGPGGSVSP